jgi:hypothetical protein
LADVAIETPIRKDERIPLRAWPQQFAASDAGNPSDLEHVAKVRIDLDLQVSGHVLMREVLHLEGFIELATPKQPAPSSQKVSVRALTNRSTPSRDAACFAAAILAHSRSGAPEPSSILTPTAPASTTPATDSPTAAGSAA